jgi:hypothetical protein
MNQIEAVAGNLVSTCGYAILIVGELAVIVLIVAATAVLLKI